jgi:hypothetical protein
MMPLANLIAYVVVFGLPIWLVAEELIHRFPAKRSVGATVPAHTMAPMVASAELERQAPEGARAHASFV